MKYVIKCEFASPSRLSWTTRTLTRQGWMLATNEALTFPSPGAASSWLRTREADEAWQARPVARGPYIEGPRGGHYYAASGSRMR